MAKKDALQDYYEKLERIANLKEKGLITDDEYVTQRATLEKKKPTPPTTATYVVFAIILCFIAWGIISVLTYRSDNPAPEGLNLSIRTSLTSIEFTNDEGTNLGNCSVEINDGYKGSVTIEAIPNAYNLSSFNKDSGERFNPLTYTVKKTLVTNCSNAPDRIGIYNN